MVRPSLTALRRGGLATVTLLASSSAPAAAQDPVPTFAEVRSVLERNCLECHGGLHRESGLSFATAETFAEGGSRGAVLHADDLSKSRLLEVIRYSNPDLAMPPSGLLPAEDLQILEQWILAGAPWPEGSDGQLADPEAHPLGGESVGAIQGWWAYEPLRRSAVPTLGSAEAPPHPVDAFLQVHHEAEQLKVSERATPEALLRRATFDLTGLPPTPSQRRAFLQAVEEQGFESAWQTLLDRLFASPQYGEHQARHWLDLVRYADTNGYERDSRKTNIWRYRDWVVRAYQDDLPYDDFVKWQLAGDEYARGGLDPELQPDAQLATGFYRLGVWDDEPADPLQAKADEIADIVDTTSQVFLGSSMSCARCHDHKADPLSQREYFQLTAYFSGVVGYRGDGTRDIADRRLDPEALTLEEQARRLSAVEQRIDAEVQGLGVAPGSAKPAQTLVADARSAAHEWRYRFGKVADQWAQPGFDDQQWKLGKAGFGTAGTPGAKIGTNWNSKRLQLRTTFHLEQIPEHLLLTLHHDEDVRVFLNGQQVFAQQGYRTDYGSYQLGLRAREALVVGRNVLAIECLQTAGGQYVDAGLSTAENRDAEGWALAMAERLESEDLDQDPRFAELQQLLRERQQVLEAKVLQPYPAQVAYERGAVPPQQYMHLRGSVHAPGDAVEPGLPQAWLYGASDSVPPSLPTLAADAPSSGRRQALAEWMFSKGSHLTARVEANRSWQFLFGRGLTRVPGDFGRLGEKPTHPALLDHLAQELIEREWSRKSLQRYLMTSEAYLRDSIPHEATLAADPRNHWFARYEPRRLTAEEFRDASLAVSGELNLKQFGPTVFPPLPAEVLATSSTPQSAWGRSSAEDAVRRSLYVHIKRSLREPLLAALDQPDPDLPCPDRFPTNVPTQALLTLNGDFTNARAVAFAASLRAASEDRESQLKLAIERALGRTASEDELARALQLLDRLQTEHGTTSERALELFLLGLLNRNEFMWLD